MAGLSRAQRVRLGLFLLIGGLLIVGTLVGLFGLAAFEQRDLYVIRFPGSVGGLGAGAQVRYNGIRVGRVEGLRIEPKDVSSVRVDVSLEPGTPIKADTVAVLEMQGLTGLRYVELSGGTNRSLLLQPGSEIKASGSTLDLLSERATSIAAKFDTLIDQLVDMTGGDTAKRVAATLLELEQTTATLRALLDQNIAGVQGLVERGGIFLDEATRLAVQGRSTLAEISAAVERIGQWVDPAQSARLLGSLNRAAQRASDRLSKAELGQSIAALNALTSRTTEAVGRADLTLLQVKDDLLKALDELVVGAEAFAEFANLLREDPAALIRGRGDAPRELP